MGLGTRSQKLKVFGTTWSARSSDLNATENVRLAIIPKLHIERDVINMQAELVNAACGIWRAPFIECIQNLYAYITHQFCGGASAVKEPGHVEVRKSSCRVPNALCRQKS